MKRSSEDKARLRTLLSNAISILCKNSLGLIDLQFSVEALIGISVGNEDVMVVSFKETVRPDGAAVSYIWQKETEEGKVGEATEEDMQANAEALYSGEHLNKHSIVSESQELLDESSNANDARIKTEKESMHYDEYLNNFPLDIQDANNSSPHVTNPTFSNAANKRRKQSVPIRVCSEQLDYDEVEKFESRSCSISRKLVANQDYPSPVRYAMSTGESSHFNDSTSNGESVFTTENTKHSVPSKQFAYRSINMSKSSKRSSSCGFSNISGKVHMSECVNDLSPNHLALNEQDVYANQAENYTYQVLNSSHSGSANGKRRKQVASSSSKNFSEQDSLIISELLPYLYDQHRPMLIPPTVTQFAPKKRCRVCYSKKIRKEVRYCCYGCSDHPGLCLDPCFYQFHLVRGSAHPKPSDSINYSQEVPCENDCLQTMDVCSSFNDVSAEMT